MIGPSRIIKNNSAQEIMIVELGQVIPVGEEIDLVLAYTLDVIARCDSLVTLIATELAVFNDGLRDYAVAEAIRTLMNIQITPSIDTDGKISVTLLGQPVSYDKKLVVQSSPRPLTPKTYTHWTGSGDDIENALRGKGPKLLISVSGSESEKHQDVQFLTDSLTYLRQAYIGWENAPWGATVHAEFYALPTILVPSPSGPYYVDAYYRVRATVSGGYVFGAQPWPVPALDANHQPCGYWELTEDYNLNYKPDGDGAYNLYPVEARLGVFLNEIPVYGTNYGMTLLDSADIEMIAPGYFLRIYVHNADPGTDWKLWAWLVCYKEDIS
jgi:hypothetical protein